MAKSRETYLKVADTFTKKGDKEWAKGKAGEGGHHYEAARKNYDTAKRAREGADRIK